METIESPGRTGDPRPEKVAIVSEVREKLDASSGAILTEYRGMSVKDMATLRRTLRDVGAEYKVYKNTLVRFAARDLGIDDLEPLLEGPTAVAFVEGDAAAVAKALRDFARTNPNLVVKGGLLGTKVLTAADTTALADLPSREVLLARIAGGLAAPMQQFAGLLQALPRNLAYGLKALIEKGGASDAGATDADETAAAPADAAEPAEDGTLGESPASDATTTAPGGDEPVDATTPDLPDSPASDATAEAPADATAEAPDTAAAEAAAETPAEGAE